MFKARGPCRSYRDPRHRSRRRSLSMGVALLWFGLTTRLRSGKQPTEATCSPDKRFDLTRFARRLAARRQVTSSYTMAHQQDRRWNRVLRPIPPTSSSREPTDEQTGCRLIRTLSGVLGCSRVPLLRPEVGHPPHGGTPAAVARGVATIVTDWG